MKKPHHIVKKERLFEDTFDLRKLLKVKVITKDGLVIGKVSHIRIHPKRMFIEGILVSRGFFRKPFYIGRSYINRFSYEAILLRITPSILFRGKKVVTSDGKVLGRVKEVIRKANRNDVENIVVSSILRKDTVISTSYIKYVGKSLFLKSN